MKPQRLCGQGHPADLLVLLHRHLLHDRQGLRGAARAARPARSRRADRLRGNPPRPGGRQLRRPAPALQHRADGPDRPEARGPGALPRASAADEHPHRAGHEGGGDRSRRAAAARPGIARAHREAGARGRARASPRSAAISIPARYVESPFSRTSATKSVAQNGRAVGVQMGVAGHARALDETVEAPDRPAAAQRPIGEGFPAAQTRRAASGGTRAPAAAVRRAARRRSPSPRAGRTRAPRAGRPSPPSRRARRPSPRGGRARRSPA